MVNLLSVLHVERPAVVRAHSKRGEMRCCGLASTASCSAKSISAEGAIVFAKACEMGIEGIVSKRAGSRYWSANSTPWLKSRNPGVCAG